MWSPRLARPGRVSRQMLHIADWLPTLVTAAGGDPSNLTVDGVDLWRALSEDTESPRTTVLHNIDDIFGVSAITVGDWKLIQGEKGNPPPRDPRPRGVLFNRVISRSREIRLNLSSSIIRCFARVRIIYISNFTSLCKNKM